MGFAFAETMEGTVEWDSEPKRSFPFKFEIAAAAESTVDHLKDGYVRVRGVLTAAPRADSVDCEGHMIIRPVGQKIVRYELAFVGDDGMSYEAVGQKDIRYRALLYSWTHLPLDILDDQHRRVGRASTIFDVKRDGWSFVRSWHRTP